MVGVCDAATPPTIRAMCVPPVRSRRRPVSNSLRPFTPRKDPAMSIHQQATIEATPCQVYALLADAAALSALSGMSGESGHVEGAPFTAFDSHVTGRQVELVPGSRIVQAWRFPNWTPGTYTVVRFELEPADNSKTRVRVDQHGYPDGADDMG